MSIGFGSSPPAKKNTPKRKPSARVIRPALAARISTRRGGHQLQRLDGIDGIASAREQPALQVSPGPAQAQMIGAEVDDVIVNEEGGFNTVFRL